MFIIIIIIVFDRVVTSFSLVSSHDFYCSLPRDQSQYVTPLLEVFVILKCTYKDSGCYYYNYVIIGVLRPLWLNRNSQLDVQQK